MFHKWMSADDDVQCLVCGGLWTTGDESEPMAANGDAPTRCTGDTEQIHGYAGGQWCTTCDKGNDVGCVHVHDCNCLLCS